MFIFETIHGTRECDSYTHNPKGMFYILDKITRVDESKVLVIYERTQWGDTPIFIKEPKRQEEEIRKNFETYVHTYNPYVYDNPTSVSNVWKDGTQDPFLKRLEELEKYITLCKTTGLQEQVLQLDEQLLEKLGLKETENDTKKSIR